MDINMNTAEITEIDPLLIKICKDAPRTRKEMGKIEDMVASITRYGQLLPILINQDYELIAGGRRLAACILGGFKAKVCFKETIDSFLLKEIEIEENLQRKNLTSAEEVLAVEELHSLKQKIHGEAKPGPQEVKGHTIADTANLLGKSSASIIEDLNLAAAIKLFPILSECKTKIDIKRAVKGMKRVASQLDALSSYEEIIKRTKEFVLVNRDFKDHIKGIGDKSIDLILTDPPYGIDIHEIAFSIGGLTGGKITTTGVQYDDSEENAKDLLRLLTVESFRVTKDTGHLYIFCAPSHFWWLKDECNRAGWITREKPIIWIKREIGQCNIPDYWPASCYEMILFARKDQSRLVTVARPDWIQCDPVLPSIRVHQAEKPVLLLKDLIQRTCYPGSYIYDPFMGSGSTIEAALEMKMLSIGCEKDQAIYASAAARMSALKKGKI